MTGGLVPAAEYDRFSVVTYARAGVRDEVEQIRRLAPPSGRPMMEAHVTIKGSFVRPTDLDLIADRIGACCAASPAGHVEADEIRVWRATESATVSLLARVTEPLVALKWRLVDALRGLCTTDYYGEDDANRVFTPHVTLVQDVPHDRLADALAVVERFAPVYAWDVALAGRRGGLRWEPLRFYPLGR